MKLTATVFILCGLAWSQPTLTPTAPATTVGTPTTITINAANIPPGVALQFSLSPVPGSPYTPVKGTSVVGTGSLTCGLSQGTSITTCVVAGDVIPIPDGPVAKLTFTPTAIGTQSITLTGALAVNAAADSPAIQVNPGPPLIISVGPSMCDVNADGVVDARDITAAITAVIAKTVNAVMDVNNDGVVNIVDAHRVVVAFKTGVCRIGL